MVSRTLVGCRYPRYQPILILQIPFCLYHCGSCFITAFRRQLQPTLSRTPDCQYLPLLVSFPIGKLWALYVPNVTLFGVELNPGPFTIKEHVLITIMAGVANEPAYAVRSSTSATQLI
jgi:hypothetical protein